MPKKNTIISAQFCYINLQVPGALKSRYQGINMNCDEYNIRMLDKDGHDPADDQGAAEHRSNHMKVA